MSRNQDIEFLHKITQEPYSVCRAMMKKNNWSIDVYFDLYVMRKMISSSEKVIESFQKSRQPAVKRVIENTRILVEQSSKWRNEIFESEGHEDDR